MNSHELISDESIEKELAGLRFDRSVGEGRLMLAELLLKAGAGFYNSHTEEEFLKKYQLLTRDRKPNKKGRMFLCSMLYTHSNNRPEYFNLMLAHRK